MTTSLRPGSDSFVIRLRSAARLVALVTLAGAQLWCASSDEEPRTADPGADASDLDSGTNEAAPSETSPTTPPPVCTAAFCRLTLAGTETVSLNGVWARGASEAWAVGSSGFAARWNGAEWQPIATGTKQTLFSVWGGSDGTVWATSTGDAFFTLNRTIDAGVDAVDSGFKGMVTAISGSGPSDVYAVGEQSMPLFDDGTTERANVWRFTRAADGWAPASPPCESYGPEGCPTFRAVWAESSGIAWFAGERGKIYRSEGTSGEQLQLEEVSSSSLRTLNGLWGFGPNDVWAVGAQGVIRHFTGGDAWSIVASPTTEDLRGVWGARPDDVWAVGDGGTVLHWDGKAWSIVEIPVNETNRPRLYAVAGAERDVWIVGESTLLRANADGGSKP